MPRTLTVLMIVVLLAVFIMPTTASGGFGFSTTPGLHEEYGDCNIWAEVVYPDAPKANLGFGGDQVPDIVANSGGVMRVYFTADTTNWKKSRVGMTEGRRLKVELNKGDRGDILSCDIALTEFDLGMNGLCPIIGDKGSHEAVISLPIFGNIGKRGIYNEAFGLLRFNLIQPILGEESFQPMYGLGLSAKEVWILAFSGGQPVIGSVAKDLVRQLTERQLAEMPMPQAYAAPTSSEPRRHQPSGIRLERRPETGSVHYQITLPEGVTKVQYSLTQTEEPIWRKVSVTSNHIRLPIELGTWHFWCQAIGSSGPIGEPVHKRIQGGE